MLDPEEREQALKQMMDASAAFYSMATRIGMQREDRPMTQNPPVRRFPACEVRVEDGPVQFGEDWPGLFLRGDTAMHYASFLAAHLDNHPPSDPIVLGMLRGLLSDLDSCNIVEREVPLPPKDVELKSPPGSSD